MPKPELINARLEVRLKKSQKKAIIALAKKRKRSVSRLLVEAALAPQQVTGEGV